MLLYKNCANGLSENAKYNVVFSYFTRLYVAHSFLDLDSAFKCYNVMLLVMNYWLHNPAAPLTKFQMLPIDGVHTPIGGVLQVYLICGNLSSVFHGGFLKSNILKLGKFQAVFTR